MDTKPKWECKVRPNLAGILATGIQASAWCAVKAVWVDEKGNQLEKPQKQPRGAGDSVLRTNQLGAWFKTPEAAFAEYERGLAAGIEYIGIGLHPQSCVRPLVAFDIDGCLDDDGHVVACIEAVEMLRSSGVYLERSPSGRGLRGFAYGTIPAKGLESHIKPYEMYGHGGKSQYVTITGVAYV